MTNSLAEEMRADEITKARRYFEKIGANPDSREDIIRLLDPGSEKKTINAALSLIDRPPSAESIDRLKALCIHSDPAIRVTSFALVSMSLKEKGTGFYVECLGHPKFRDKSQAVYLIWRYGDASAVPAMTKRLSQIISTRKGRVACFHNGESELTHCLDYLHPHQELKEVRKVFQRMIDQWAMLEDKEAWWIVDHLKFFDHTDLRRSDHCLSATAKLYDDDEPILLACANGDIASVRKFLEEGGSVYSRGSNTPTLARLALRTGNLDMLKLLVEFGLDLERPVHGFHDFLILEAIKAKNETFIDYILEQKIDLNRADPYGTTIFMDACGLAEPGVVRRMIGLGANIHDRRRSDVTPFLQAVRAEALEVMELLVEQGVNPDEVDERGKTPLIRSAQGGRIKSVEWLLRHGANVTHCEKPGRDALCWAMENKHPDIADLLRKYLNKN